MSEKKVKSNCEYDLKCVFSAYTEREKEKKYIDNYISDNGKSSNVSRICARIDKTLIRCHVFNIDQMKIQIVRSMVCVFFFPFCESTFDCFSVGIEFLAVT